MAEWSLEAVVRGWSNLHGDVDHTSPALNYPVAVNDDHGFLCGFPEIFHVSTSSNDDLEDLYKPFHHQVSCSLPSSMVLDFQGRQDGQQDQQQQQALVDHSSGSAGSDSTRVCFKPKYKRRKNQRDRVVIQVSAEDVTSDMWAWRKYGQKPIKSSPYPRSYYRCSSSKGCLARKQVEQSFIDPRKFIITYTDEHSHSKPTKRNSLAGTVRQKFPVSKSSFRSDRENGAVSFVSSHQERRIKEENQTNEKYEVGFKMESKENYDDLVMSEFLLNEDFFSGLEEFDEFIKRSPTSSMASYDSLLQIPFESYS